MNQFIQSSLSPDLFQVEDVESDNACFYRSLANALAFVSKKIEQIPNLKNGSFHHYRHVDDFYADDNWGYNGENQEILARSLQESAVAWIKNKQNELAPLPKNAPELTYEVLVNMIHEISISEYLENYSHFAGDLVVLDKTSIHGDTDVDNIDNPEQFTILDDRWGGFVEQLALSEYLKLPIVVLTAQKYDTRLKKIITGRIHRNKPIKGVRFKVYQTSGLEYLTRGRPVLYLLWKKTKNGDHYMSLYPKDQDRCLETIKTI